MSFFAMPAWEPPSGYRIPAWLRPPEHIVPGIVPVELLLARTDTDAVLVTDLRAYPTGLEFALTARPHPDQLQQRRHDPDRPHRFVYRDLWLELRFANGQTASNHPRSWPHTFETEQPDPPFLYQGHWPSYAPGQSASSSRQASSSTPAWCWRWPLEPQWSGRRAKHRPGLARQPVQPRERARPHLGPVGNSPNP
jgi:hypothetical protein